MRAAASVDDNTAPRLSCAVPEQWRFCERRPVSASWERLAPLTTLDARDWSETPATGITAVRSGDTGGVSLPLPEPRRDLRRWFRVSHGADNGEENRDGMLRTADAANSCAETRSTVPGSVARHPHSRHGCATTRRALTRGAYALMTDSETHPVTAASFLPAIRHLVFEDGFDGSAIDRTQRLRTGEALGELPAASSACSLTQTPSCIRPRRYRTKTVSSRLSTRVHSLGLDAPARGAISRPLRAGSKAAPSVTLISFDSRPRATLMMSPPSRSRRPQNVAPDLTTTRNSACSVNSPTSSARPSSIGTPAQNGAACSFSHGASPRQQVPPRRLQVGDGLRAKRKRRRLVDHRPAIGAPVRDVVRVGPQQPPGPPPVVHLRTFVRPQLHDPHSVGR